MPTALVLLTCLHSTLGTTFFRCKHCTDDSSLASYLSLWPSMLLFLSLEATTLPLLHVIILLPELASISGLLPSSLL